MNDNEHQAEVIARVFGNESADQFRELGYVLEFDSLTDDLLRACNTARTELRTYISKKHDEPSALIAESDAVIDGLRSSIEELRSNWGFALNSDVDVDFTLDEIEQAAFLLRGILLKTTDMQDVNDGIDTLKQFYEKVKPQPEQDENEQLSLIA